MDDPADALWDAFDGRPHEVRMGLRPLDAGAWVPPASRPELTSELDRKAALLAERPGEVLASIEGIEAQVAAAELADVLVGHLVKAHPDRYQRRDAYLVLLDDGRFWAIDQFDPLDLAGRVVGEDWCLVTPDSPPLLGAATLCSPNRWRLVEKLGRPVTDIHEPVPHYRKRLATPVDAVLAGRPRGMWRRNWSIQSSPSRFQPVADGPARPNVPEEVWVRSEYETLLRLSVSGWWVFGIQTTIRPLSDVAGRPALARRIHTAVATLDGQTAAYKDLAEWRDSLTTWLARVGW